MVKAVIFDLYETLVTQSGTVVPRAGALGDSLGLEPTAYRREWKRLRPQALSGQLTFEEAIIEACRRLDVAISAELVRRASIERTCANAEVFRKIDPKSVALTRELQSRSVRLATISNCMAEDVHAWPDCALAPQFVCASFSCAVGSVKPDLAIYRTTIEQLGVSPEETLYIGDGGDDELAGAERAGLRAAQAGWFVARPITTFPFLATREDVAKMVLE